MMANAGGGSWTWVWPAARRRVGVVGLVACLAIGDVGRCCDNPVFRYALENWPSAEYLLVTAGAEAAADARLLEAWHEGAWAALAAAHAHATTSLGSGDWDALICW